MDNLLCVFCCCWGEKGEAGIDFKEISSLRKNSIQLINRFTFCNGNTPLELVEGDA